MNILFTILFLSSASISLLSAPESLLPALLDGAGKGASVCVSLIATYSVWLGLMHLWEDSGITEKISHVVKPLARKLFKTSDDEALRAISMNLSVNLLGISGAATPYGIKAANLLDKTENAEYSSAMLFVLNATSLQVIPTSIIAVRVALNSVSPMDIVIPTILASALSTALGILLTRLFLLPKTTKSVQKYKKTARFTAKTKGAGI